MVAIKRNGPIPDSLSAKSNGRWRDAKMKIYPNRFAARLPCDRGGTRAIGRERSRCGWHGKGLAFALGGTVPISSEEVRRMRAPSPRRHRQPGGLRARNRGVDRLRAALRLHRHLGEQCAADDLTKNPSPSMSTRMSRQRSSAHSSRRSGAAGVAFADDSGGGGGVIVNTRRWRREA